MKRILVFRCRLDGMPSDQLDALIEIMDQTPDVVEQQAVFGVDITSMSCAEVCALSYEMFTQPAGRRHMVMSVLEIPA